MNESFPFTGIPLVTLLFGWEQWSELIQCLKLFHLSLPFLSHEVLARFHVPSHVKQVFTGVILWFI